VVSGGNLLWGFFLGSDGNLLWVVVWGVVVIGFGLLCG